jgi:hypothetical protein
MTSDDDVGLTVPPDRAGSHEPIAPRGLGGAFRGKASVIYTKPGLSPIVLPRQAGDIPRGALRSICHVAGWEYPPHR